VDGFTQSFAKRVKVILPKDIGHVQVSPEDIEVTVRIEMEEIGMRNEEEEF